MRATTHRLALALASVCAVATPCLALAPQGSGCAPATATDLGTPCGSASLTSELPVLGTTMTMTIDSTSPSFAGVLFQNDGNGSPVPFMGCDIYLSQLLTAAVFVTDANGDADIFVDVPMSPSLCGAQLVVQGAIASGLGPVLGFEVTNATALRVGSQPPTGGTLPAGWIHGSANCNQNNDPPIQVHAYTDSMWILRQNACLNFEAPFMYLIAGDQKAMLIDTGATSSASLFPIRATVQSLLDAYEAANNLPDLELIVTHSHGHGDHRQGDGQFFGQPNTTVVGTSVSAVSSFFGITNWPTTQVSYDLGGRLIDILAAPGHQSAHIIFYDRETGALLTGDTFYPGFLFISDLSSYKPSVARIVAFTDNNPITDILGGHVEMTATPGVWYSYGTVYQPDEHVLQLTLANLLELNTALASIFGSTTEVHDDFIINVF